MFSGTPTGLVEADSLPEISELATTFAEICAPEEFEALEDAGPIHVVEAIVSQRGATRPSTEKVDNLVSEAGELEVASGVLTAFATTALFVVAFLEWRKNEANLEKAIIAAMQSVGLSEDKALLVVARLKLLRKL